MSAFSPQRYFFVCDIEKNAHERCKCWRFSSSGNIIKNLIVKSPHNHTLFSPTHTPHNTHPTKQNHGSYQANRTKVHRRQGPAKAARHQSSPKVRPTNSKPFPLPSSPRITFLLYLFFAYFRKSFLFYYLKVVLDVSILPTCLHPGSLCKALPTCRYTRAECWRAATWWCGWFCSMFVV